MSPHLRTHHSDYEIMSQLAVTLSPICHKLGSEANTTSFKIFGMTISGIEPTPPPHHSRRGRYPEVTKAVFCQNLILICHFSIVDFIDGHVKILVINSYLTQIFPVLTCTHVTSFEFINQILI